LVWESQLEDIKLKVDRALLSVLKGLEDFGPGFGSKPKCVIIPPKPFMACKKTLKRGLRTTQSKPTPKRSSGSERVQVRVLSLVCFLIVVCLFQASTMEVDSVTPRFL
jgi:hypothetical protein